MIKKFLGWFGIDYVSFDKREKNGILEAFEEVGRLHAALVRATGKSFGLSDSKFADLEARITALEKRKITKGRTKKAKK